MKESRPQPAACKQASGYQLRPMPEVRSAMPYLGIGTRDLGFRDLGFRDLGFKPFLERPNVLRDPAYLRRVRVGGKPSNPRRSGVGNLQSLKGVGGWESLNP